MEMKQKCFGIRNNSLIQTKHFFLIPRPKQKNMFFRFLDPNKQKCFQIPRPKRGIFMTKSLLLFSAGRLFHRQKVGHGNETKMFRNQKQFFDPNKTFFFDSSTQTKKYVF